MAPQRDTFDRARSLAAAFLVAAGAAVILGVVLDWVTVEPPPIIPADHQEQTQPFTGLETKSAPYLLIGAGAVILLALLLVARRRPMYAWAAFLTSMAIGAIAFQNYRDLSSPGSELFYEQMDRVGDPAPAIGLMLVAAGGIVGVIAGAAGVSSIPPDRSRTRIER